MMYKIINYQSKHNDATKKSFYTYEIRSVGRKIHISFLKNKIIPSYYYESDGLNGIDAFEGLHNDIADGISNICIKYHYKYITSILILQKTSLFRI